ncbi:hypothetical protein T439DRAFT_327954 [Meredithblackwellia eburnea MCA 4105]
MGLLRHLTIATAIGLNLIVVALAIFTRLVVVTLPTDGASQQWLSRLPQFASVVGNAVAGLSGVAIWLICREWAIRTAVGKGFTFSLVEAVTELSSGGIPKRSGALFFLAVLIAAAKAFTSSALVGALTPTNLPTKYSQQNFATAEFSSGSGIPDVTCEYGQTYGYGRNCPMNTAFGVIYDAGLQAFTGTIPANYTRGGVTYPAELSGISGVISNMTRAAADSIFPNQHRILTSRDMLSACVPRMKVSTTCSPTIRRAGYSVTTSAVALGSLVFQPASITVAQLQNSGTTTDRNTAPDYGYGSVIVFGVKDSSNGATSAIIVSTGNYVNDYTSGTIECNVTAVEEQIRVNIQASAFLSVDKDNACPTRPQPSTSWLPNLTFLAQMALQKQQGQDGRLEAVALLAKGASTITAFETALTRMVAVGATEMYSILDTYTTQGINNGTYPTTPFKNQQTLVFSTPVYRLGADSAEYWVAAPGLMALLLIAGWLRFCFHAQVSKFNPLDPVSMAAAGLNAIETPPEIRAAGNTSARKLADNLGNMRFRHGLVAFGRLGLTTRPIEEAPPPRADTVYTTSDNNNNNNGASGEKLVPSMSSGGQMAMPVPTLGAHQQQSYQSVRPYSPSASPPYGHHQDLRY